MHVLLALGLLATPSADSITYRTTAKRTELVLADMQRLMGRPLHAAPSVAKLAMIVSIKDQPADQILANLAKATVSKWEGKSDGLWLVPDLPARKARRAAYLGAQVARFRESIAATEAKGFLGRLPRSEQEIERSEGAGRMWGSPQQRLALRILRAMPDAALTVDRPTPTTLLSSAPTFFRRGFGISIDSLVDVYVRELEDFRKFFPQEPGRTLSRIDLQLYGPTEARAPIIGVRTRDSVGLQNYSMIFLDNAEPTKLHPLLAKLDPKLPLAASKLTLSMPREQDGDVSIPDQNVLSELLRPEDFDPLRTVASDVWLQLADVLHQNVVACPRDFWLDADDLELAPPTLKLYARFLWDEGTEVSDGWITNSPSLETPGFRQFDRAALGKYLRKRAKDGIESVRSLAELAATIDTVDDPQSLRSYAAVATPLTTPSTTLDWATMRFIGTLSDLDREAFLAGGSLAISRLSPRAIGALGDMIEQNNSEEVMSADYRDAEIRLRVEPELAFWVRSPAKAGIVRAPELTQAETIADAWYRVDHKLPAVDGDPAGGALICVAGSQIVKIELITTSAPAIQLDSGEILGAPPKAGWFTLGKVPQPVRSALLDVLEARRRNSDDG